MAVRPNHLPNPEKDSATETISFTLRLPLGITLSRVKEIPLPQVTENTLSFEAIALQARSSKTRKAWGLDELSAEELETWPVRTENITKGLAGPEEWAEPDAGPQLPAT